MPFGENTECKHIQNVALSVDTVLEKCWLNSAVISEAVVFAHDYIV